VSKKGTGFEQPLAAQQHWHIDVSYINISGTFYYLCSILDGFSRYIVNWDLRKRITEADIEIIMQRAKEKYPEARPRIISDNGPQFIAKDFKEFIRISGMTHVRTSPFYPQSNGKIERWHKSLKSECIRPGTPLSLDDARRLVEGYVDDYNNVRLNSATGYITPKDILAGRQHDSRGTRPQAGGGQATTAESPTASRVRHKNGRATASSCCWRSVARSRGARNLNFRIGRLYALVDRFRLATILPRQGWIAPAFEVWPTRRTTRLTRQWQGFGTHCIDHGESGWTAGALPILARSGRARAPSVCEPATLCSHWTAVVNALVPISWSQGAFRVAPRARQRTEIKAIQLVAAVQPERLAFVRRQRDELPDIYLGRKHNCRRSGPLEHS